MIPIAERLMRKIRIEASSGCWLWTGTKTNGYGRIARGHQWEEDALTHRVAYESFVGPIPDGQEIHHLCENRLCCCPSHLRAVTYREHIVELTKGNAAYLNARKTHCIKGHEYTPANTLIMHWHNNSRRCRVCRNAYESKRKRNKRARDRAIRHTDP